MSVDMAMGDEQEELSTIVVISIKVTTNCQFFLRIEFSLEVLHLQDLLYEIFCSPSYAN